MTKLRSFLISSTIMFPIMGLAQSNGTQTFANYVGSLTKATPSNNDLIPFTTVNGAGQFVEFSTTPALLGLISGTSSVGVNVITKGADPTGSADSTAAFNAAITAAGVNGLVVVPPGTFKGTDISVNVAGVTIQCEGAPTLMLPSGSGTAHLLVLSASGITVQGCQFNGSANTGSGYGVYSSVATSNVNLDDNGFASFSAIPISLLDSASPRITRSRITTAGIGGINVQSDVVGLAGPQIQLNQIDMTGLPAAGGNRTGINVQGMGTGPTVLNALIEDNRVLFPTNPTTLAGTTYLAIQAQNAPKPTLNGNFVSGGNYNLSVSQSPGAVANGNNISQTISIGIEIADSPNSSVSGGSIVCQSPTASLPGSTGVFFDGGNVLSGAGSVTGVAIKGCSNAVADQGGNDFSLSGGSFQGPFATMSGGPIQAAVRLQNVTGFTLTGFTADDASADVADGIFLDNSTAGNIGAITLSNFSQAGSNQVQLFSSTVSPANISFHDSTLINNWNGGGLAFTATGSTTFSNITASNDSGYFIGAYDLSTGTATLSGSSSTFNALLDAKTNGAPTGSFSVGSEDLNYAAATPFGMKCIYTAGGWVNLIGGACSDTGGGVFVGQLLGVAGTASAPGYSFSGDATAGMWLGGHAVTVQAGSVGAVGVGPVAQILGGSGGTTSGNGGPSSAVGGNAIGDGNGGNGSVIGGNAASITGTAHNGAPALLRPGTGVNGGADGAAQMRDASNTVRVNVLGSQITVTGTESVSTLTASLPVYTDASKNLTSTAPAGYSAVLSGTSGSLGGGALLAGACSSSTVSITGATTSMVVGATPAAYPGDAIYWKAYVSSSNTVTVDVCAAIAATPTSTTYNVRVFQ